MYSTAPQARAWGSVLGYSLTTRALAQLLVRLHAWARRVPAGTLGLGRVSQRSCPIHKRTRSADTLYGTHADRPLHLSYALQGRQIRGWDGRAHLQRHTSIISTPLLLAHAAHAACDGSWCLSHPGRNTGELATSGRIFILAFAGKERTLRQVSRLVNAPRASAACTAAACCGRESADAVCEQASSQYRDGGVLGQHGRARKVGLLVPNGFAQSADEDDRMRCHFCHR